MKKKVLSYLQITLVPFILQLFVRFIYLTSTKKYHHPILKDDKPFIATFWHGDLLMQPFNYYKLKPKGTVKGMISEHRDGVAIQKTMNFLGIGSIAGSSTRGGVKALINAIKTLKSGTDIAITPDGPKGPIYSIADGVIAMSIKANAPIMIFSSIPNRYWKFNSWDKFIIPKPFCTIDFYVSEAFYVDDIALEDAKKLLYKKMMINQLEK